MRRLLVAVILLTLTGCSRDSGEGGSGRRFSEFQFHLEDGRSVTCIYYHAGTRGGLSCDWANASTSDGGEQ